MIIETHVSLRSVGAMDRITARSNFCEPFVGIIRYFAVCH